MKCGELKKMVCNSLKYMRGELELDVSKERKLPSLEARRQISERSKSAWRKYKQDSKDNQSRGIR